MRVGPFENEDGSRVWCPEVQAYPSNMKSHWSTHCPTPIESYPCMHCDSTFTRKESRDDHIASQHKAKGSAAAAAAELFNKQKL